MKMMFDIYDDYEFSWEQEVSDNDFSMNANLNNLSLPVMELGILLPTAIDIILGLLWELPF